MSIIREHNENNWIKLIISILFLLLSLNIILLNSNPLPGYVYSFYEHVPVFFWISSVIIFFTATLILIGFRQLQMKYVYTLFFLILLNNAIILFSPYICGAYLMNGGDLPTHGGMILDIFFTGKIDFDINFYPLAHILAFGISSLSNIDYMNVVKTLAPFFSLLLPIYSYILVKEITDRQFAQTLTFLISSTFYFSSLFQPNSITTPMGLSLLMLPLLFYLFIKSSKKGLSFVLCFLLCISAYIFFHPLTSFILVFSFVLLHVLSKTFKTKLSYNGLLYYICAFLAYLFYLTRIWINPMRNIYQFFLGYRPLPGYAVDIQGYLGKLGLKGFDLLLFFIKTFGHQVLLLLLSSLSVISLLFGITNKRKYFKEIWFLTIFSFSIVSGAFLLVQIVMPTLMNISFFRYLEYLLVFTPILSALFLSNFSYTLCKRIFIIFILLFLFINSLLVVYPSPYIHELNTQVTYVDLSGSEWILDYMDKDTGLSGYFGAGITIRIISGLVPYSEFYKKRYTIWYDQKTIIPDHLGYEKNNTIWDTIQEKRYLIINKYDIVAYTQVYKNLNRVSLEDVDRAKNDHTASFVYNNGEYLIFYISR